MNIEWVEFLDSMTHSGINAAVGVVISMIVEYWPAYSTFEPKAKRLVFFGLCFTVPIAGLVLGLATGVYQFVDFPSTIFPILAAGSAAAFSGTVVHTRLLK